jgi:hypothetical protein
MLSLISPLIFLCYNVFPALFRTFALLSPLSTLFVLLVDRADTLYWHFSGMLLFSDRFLPLRVFSALSPHEKSEWTNSQPQKSWGVKGFPWITIPCMLFDQQFGWIWTSVDDPIGMRISTEKVQAWYTSQCYDASRIGLLREEFVIALGNFLVCAYYMRGTSLVREYFEWGRIITSFERVLKWTLWECRIISGWYFSLNEMALSLLHSWKLRSIIDTCWTCQQMQASSSYSYGSPLQNLNVWHSRCSTIIHRDFTPQRPVPSLCVTVCGMIVIFSLLFRDWLIPDHWRLHITPPFFSNLNACSKNLPDRHKHHPSDERSGSYPR